MARRKLPATFGEYVKAVSKVAVEKCGITDVQADWLVQQPDVRVAVSVGWGIQNTPTQVLQAVLCGVLAAWIKFNMKG